MLTRFLNWLKSLFPPPPKDILIIKEEPAPPKPKEQYIPLKWEEDYKFLYRSARIRKEKTKVAGWYKSKALEHKDKYVSVSDKLGVPWEVVACIHGLEGAFDFSKNLHNGEPWNKRTKLWPRGRGPFKSWEDSAIDALSMKKKIFPQEWTPVNTLYFLERYNGLGYRKYHPDIKSPYIWSFTNHYSKGKYVADGKFSRTAVSRQCGCYAILERLGYFPRNPLV